MIPAKEFEGKLWVKAEDHQRAMQEAQRRWRWLTDEEIYEAFDTIIEEPKQAIQFCYKIQAKLKEKNT